MNHLLKVKNEASDNSIEIDDYLVGIDDYLDEEDCSLFVPDSPFSILIG
ncbi:hypothetical protein [Lysinibacillus sp. Ag94]|nr:hypothetical protein [Lysinibacillus sp. Ag94]UPW84178.1 hypothetical protein MY533_04710 [Lysinibacillus sp. Ag94]